MKVEGSYSGVIMPIMIVLLTFILGNLFQNDAINNLVCIALIFWVLCYCINAFTNDSKKMCIRDRYKLFFKELIYIDFDYDRCVFLLYNM